MHFRFVDVNEENLHQHRRWHPAVVTLYNSKESDLKTNMSAYENMREEKLKYFPFP